MFRGGISSLRQMDGMMMMRRSREGERALTPRSSLHLRSANPRDPQDHSNAQTPLMASLLLMIGVTDHHPEGHPLHRSSGLGKVMRPAPGLLSPRSGRTCEERGCVKSHQPLRKTLEPQLRMMTRTTIRIGIVWTAPQTWRGVCRQPRVGHKVPDIMSNRPLKAAAPEHPLPINSSHRRFLHYIL
jgi:hypothetical protein